MSKILIRHCDRGHPQELNLNGEKIPWNTITQFSTRDETKDSITLLVWTKTVYYSCHMKDVNVAVWKEETLDVLQKVLKTNSTLPAPAV
jgi:hypothetical protein